MIDSSTTGLQRRSTSGGANPNSQAVIVGRSISRNSARNVSVTSERTEPNTPPAMPSRALAASGRPAASSLSALRTVSSIPAVETMSWKTALLVSSSQNSGSIVDELRDLVPQRAGGDDHDREDRDEQRREHDERRPAALPAAADERADHRVEPERDHRGDEDRQQRAERDHREHDEGAEPDQRHERADGDGDLDALR